MTIEEKAKAYDEALERVKPLYEWAKKDDSPMWSTYEYLFPQLAESEDERTRKEIIHYLFYAAGGLSIEEQNRWIAYLEKQKEPHFTKRNALFDKCVENCDPKTVEEVNKRVDDIMNMPELSAFEQALTNFIGFWEDDEEKWPSKFVKKHGKHILDMAREELQKEQKPAEWSEEDEEVMEDLYNFVISDFIQDHIHETRWKPWKTTLERNRQNRLKSIRPVSKEFLQSWKPSEEQMKALLKVVDKARELHYTSIDGYDGYNALRSLYEQIKKL